MAISLKHSKVSAVADGGDTNLVQPSDWNAEHTLTQATSRVLGRVTASAGATEELTAAQVRTLINVEDGATADQTAAEILTALLTVDGAGSLLDADLLDGLSSAAFAVAAHTHAFADLTAKPTTLVGYGITDAQPLNTQLTDIAALAVTDGNIIVGNGITWVAESGATARTSLGLGTGNSPQFSQVNIGDATDTTILRVAAGRISVEGAELQKQPTTNGILARTAAGAAAAARTITGTANQITVTDGDGVAGNPTLALHADVYRAGGTDVAVADGGTGSSTARGAVANLGSWFVLANSAVAVTRNSVNGAGDATETTAATVSVPAGAMGPNGAIRIMALWTYTNSANTKTVRARLGGLSGTAYSQWANTTTATLQTLTLIRNVNSESSQKAHPATTANHLGSSSTGVTTSAINTAVAQDIVFTTAWAGATASESITLEAYTVEVFYGA